MSQPRDDRQDDLFRSSLEQIINLRHPLVRLAAEINWDFLAKRFSSVCRLGACPDRHCDGHLLQVNRLRLPLRG